MGYRSTLCSEHHSGELPEWFKEKYEDQILFPDGLLVVSKREAKYYDNEFFEDYQKAVNESGFWKESDLSITLAVLSEDGFISRVIMSMDRIYYSWMDESCESDYVWNQG